MRLAQSFGRARRRACSPDLGPTPRASLISSKIRVAIRINASGFRCNGSDARRASVGFALEKRPMDGLLSYALFEELVTRAGVHVADLRPEVTSRMRLLANLTESLADCDHAAQLAQVIFAYYDTHKPQARFTELERRIVLIGSLFSDIGKTGPAGASPEAQQLITEMFSIENVPTPAMSIHDFLAHYFAADADRREQALAALGIAASRSMRWFWNCHSAWTLDIIDRDGVPVEAVAAAATHHLLENVNPGKIVAEDGHFTRDFGLNRAFDRPEKLVIVLDKYDASRRRAGRDHESTIAWLHDMLDRNLRFGGDAVFRTLVEDARLSLGACALYAGAP